MIGLIPTNWVEWIQDSFNRGCCKDRTKQILLENQFPLADVELAINSIWYNTPPLANLTPDFTDMYINTEQTEVDNVSIEFLHTAPTVAVFKNLLTVEQCNSIIELGKSMRRATVVGEQDRVVSEWRTNDLQCLAYNETPDTVYLEKQIAKITGIPVENGERFQLLHYQPGQFYKPHNDWFFRDNVATRLASGGQRVATCVVYLNSPESGGQTRFPKLNIEVFPTAGSAVYFEYTNKLGQTTDQCLHSSEPVVSGEKWVLTKWLRTKPQMPQEFFDVYK